MPVATTPAVTPATADLLASLEIRGDGWEQALAGIPAAKARGVAIEFLREGDFLCRQVEEEYVGCGSSEERFTPVAAEATIEDPCLRRLVAVWALGQLEATDVPDVIDGLAEIVALPTPERELGEAVVALLPPGEDTVRLRLIEVASAAARDDVADALLPGLTPGGAARALLDLEREKALEQLGDQPVPATLAAALDGGVSQMTAHAILNRLEPADLDIPAVAAAVRAAAVSDDCLLAGTAALLFDGGGDPQYLPRHAGLTSEAAATRALCIAARISEDEALEVLRALTARDGLDLVNIDHGWPGSADGHDPDLDGDGDPSTSTTRTHVPPGDLDFDAMTRWLPTECGGGTCVTFGGDTVTLGFARTPHGGLALDEIAVERVEHGCGC